jgi:nucleoside phosphorylase
MKTIFNVGKLHETSYYSEIIKNIGNFDIYEERLTGAKIFKNEKCQIIFNCYGAFLAWDVLNSIKPKDKLILVGAFGSISKDVKIGDVLIPTEIETNLLEMFLNKEIVENKSSLTQKLEEILKEKKIKYLRGKLGTVAGIFDPLGNHKLSKAKGCLGVECEAATVLRWCEINNVEATAILYCSDDTERSAHVKDEVMSNIGMNMRKKLNMISYELIAKI